jgi:hypothetical protein
MTLVIESHRDDLPRIRGRQQSNVSARGGPAGRSMLAEDVALDLDDAFAVDHPVRDPPLVLVSNES